MENVNSINTNQYWNKRFEDDWEEFSGPEQSRFFSKIALDNLPGWLIFQIKTQAMTIADWGCAEGDGTAVWESYVNTEKIFGIDFSEVAIKKAAARYPSINFISCDWLKSTGTKVEKFDIVFSSNTLEHFHKPYEVLNAIQSHAAKAVILALPYCEINRIKEHFYTFLPENIPVKIGDEFKLIWSKVIDCHQLANSHWPGQQIIIVYARSEWVDSLGLTLNDMSIEKSDISLRARYLENLQIQIDELSAALVRSDEKVSRLLQIEKQRDEALAARNALKNQLDALLQSKSWLITKPLRAFFELLRMGLTSANLRNIASLLKPMWRILPIPQNLRQNISGWARRLLVQEKIKSKTHWMPPLSLSGEGNGVDYILWGVIDWHFRHQRPQQLGSQIAATGRRVFYISVDFVNSSEPGFTAESLDADGRLFNIHLHLKGAPSIYGKPPTKEQLAQLQQSMGRVLDWTNSTSVVSLIQHSYWFDLAAQLPNSRLVYDCMDHHEGFGGVSAEMIAHERALLAAADVTVTTSLWLDKEVANKTNRHVLIRNATEYGHFANVPADIYKDPQGRRVIGYYGAIAEWFDVELMAYVAKAFPECAILLIGADTVGAQKQLASCNNVLFLGEIPYKELPRYAHAFDVCLLPFKVIPLTLATNPVKAYEYLSMGKPVVSTGLPEVKEMGSVCALANNASDFVSLVRQYLDNPGSAAERQAFAQAQTWEHRAKDLIDVSEDCQHDPLVSIVVVTYNNLDLTKQCLASLDAYSDYPNLEVIVVDNASSDGSPEWLQQWAAVEAQKNRTLILNADNRGFAAGNNQGLAIATGEYLVMLNNDTHVTPGWVRTMVNHMRRNPELGLLGPVTNNIGNEARIDIFYDDMTQMLARAAQYTHAHLGQLYPLRTAAFFCVMLKRAVFEKIGPLDEAFGRGFFEDDDYCRRVEQSGLKIACAEDVFIHHHLSASFNKLKSQDRQKLFEDNKIIYESKWGTWFPHTHR